MLYYVLNRLWQAMIVLLLISLAGFLLVDYLGDPLASLLPADASQAQRDELIATLNLNAGLFERFGHFLNNLLHGSLGLSYRTHEPVTALILQRLPATLELAAVSFIITLVLGVAGGVFCAVYARNFIAKLVMFASLAGITLPTFVLGVLLILVFSVKLNWLPSFGRGDVVAIGNWWTTGLLTKSGWLALVLPAITLSMFQVTFVLRMIRSQLLEIEQMDFIRFSRARGLPRRAIWFIHALKNALVPVVTIAGLQLGNIIAFSVVTESVFAWPGIGLLFLQSIQSADLPVISAYLILIGAIFIVINLLIELSYPFLDPRILAQGARK